MKQSSGIDALLEALRQSGMNTDGVGSPFGGGGAAGAGRAPDDSADAAGGGAKTPHFETPHIVENMKSWSKKAIVVAAIVLIVVILAAYWWFHPPINIHSVDTWIFLAVLVLLPLFVFFRARSGSYEKGTGKHERSEGKAKTFKALSFVPVAVAVVGVVGAVMSLSIFPGNAAKYATVLNTVDHDFASDIQEVNYSEIPVIDRDSAILLGNREMGSIPEYVSQFEISSLYSQINYQGTPVRVSPLGYADLFKWFTNRASGIPAYALVDMTTQDAQIVTLGDNAIFYSQSEPLARNIDRYVQLKYPFYMFDEKSFEIDEDGNPWWICPVQSRTIGLFGGTTISRVVMVNATTGECTDIAIDEVPEWVDRAYPAELLIQQYNWSGAYKDGWLNSWLGQKNVVQTTPGTDGNVGYNYIAKDDDVWVYTGVTSATADNSIVGFVLVNQRTAESHFYSVAGATEESAMQSAEGQVQNLRYTATFPLLINVANQPTYFMALKDSAGLVKKFAMIDIQRYQNVAVGDTVAECQKSYEALLATNGVVTDEGGDTSTLEKQGIIARMTQAVMEGNSHFYVTLEGDSAIYDFGLPGMLEIVGYAPGDVIKFTYIDSGTAYPVQSIEQESASADAGANSTSAAGAQAVAADASDSAAPAATGAQPSAQNA